VSCGSTTLTAIGRNPDKGDEPDAYGEVVIYALEIAHE